VWTWCLERVPDDKREEWIKQMNDPLPGSKSRGPTEAELQADADTFMAAMLAHGAR